MTDREKELPLKWDQEVAYIGPMVSHGTVYGYKTVGSEHPHAVPVISRDKAESQLTELRRQVASLKEAAEELADLVDHFREGSYQIDSFTTQPVRVALAELEQKKGE